MRCFNARPCACAQSFLDHHHASYAQDLHAAAMMAAMATHNRAAARHAAPDS